MNRSLVRASVALALLAASSGTAAATPASLEAARHALTSGDAATAVSMYEVLTNQGESLEAELGLVRAAFQAGEFRKAMSWATLTAGEHKDSAESVALLAYLHDRVGHTEQALQSLKRMQQSHPQEAVVVAVHADILIDRAGAAQARTLLKDWIAKNPGARNTGLTELLARAETAAAARAGAHIADKALPTSAMQVWRRPSFEAFPIGAKRIASGANGIVVDDGRHVLTYAAALPAQGTIYVRNGLGKVRRAERMAGQSQGDLVRLKLSEPYPAEWALPKDQLAAPEGTRFCFALGFSVPGSTEATWPAIAPGLVFRADAGIGGLMQITSALGAGHVGSPVFDPRGRLVGITTGAGDVLIGGKNVRGQLGAGQFALRTVSAESMKGKDGAALARPTSPIPPMPAVEELYERLSPSVVQIVVAE